MSADLEFVLGYMLSQELGREVDVKIEGVDPKTGTLTMVVDGRRVSFEFRQCKTDSVDKALRCIEKALSRDENTARRFVEEVRRALATQ